MGGANIINFTEKHANFLKNQFEHKLYHIQQPNNSVVPSAKVTDKIFVKFTNNFFSNEVK